MTIHHFHTPFRWLAVLLCLQASLAFCEDDDACNPESAKTTICGKIQTYDGQSLWIAPGGGGMDGSGSTPPTVLETAQSVQSGQFTLIQLSATTFRLMTAGNKYLSATNGGGVEGAKEPVRTAPSSDPTKPDAKWWTQLQIIGSPITQRSTNPITAPVTLRTSRGFPVQLVQSLPQAGNGAPISYCDPASDPKCPGDHETFTWLPNPNEEDLSHRKEGGVQGGHNHPNSLCGATSSCAGMKQGKHGKHWKLPSFSDMTGKSGGGHNHPNGGGGTGTADGQDP